MSKSQFRVDLRDTVDQPTTSVHGHAGPAGQRGFAAAGCVETHSGDTEGPTFLVARAELRDSLAEWRDRAADKRDMAANLDAFVKGVDDRAAFEARQLAQRDRRYAKLDRIAAEQDRHELLNGY